LGVADSSKPERKNGPGRPFQPGQTGNPGGRSKAATLLRQAIESLHEDAGARLRELLHSDDEKIALEATKFTIEHIKGKPSQAITGEDGGPILVDMGVVDMLRKLAT
jgi:hypothetical protein